MNNISEISQLFIQFCCIIQTHFGKDIKRKHYDNGKEFVKHSFYSFICKHASSMNSQVSTPPQENWVAERKLFHLL